MKAVENGIDLGMGLLVIVLCLSTAFFGLSSYSKTDLYNGLTDKNTVDVEGTILPSDNVLSKSVHELTLSLVAAAQNRDNIRQLSIVIKHKTNPNDIIFEDNYSLIENYDETYLTIRNAMDQYIIESPFGEQLNKGNYQAFVTSDQSNITCYFLVN